MPVDVIVGGQGGDEGKGKIAAYLALNGDYKIGMRVPAPQAGHSIIINGKRVGLASLPSCLVKKDLRLLIGIGGLISEERLLEGETRFTPDNKKIEIPAEIPATGITPERLGIDYETRVVTKEHKKKEREDPYLMGHVGSVGSGTSSCRIDSILRLEDLPRARDIEGLQSYLTDTKKEIYKVLEAGGDILLEGDHGAKICFIHGEYPFVTTRIVNEAGFISEAGIPSREVNDVYVILKPYTTRSATGPLEERITDEKALHWFHTEGGETGTVSQKLRGIGLFEWENVKQVLKMNSATKLAVTHMDCPDYVWKAIGFKDDKDFLERINKELCDEWPYPEIALLSYGPKDEDTIPYKK